MCRLPENMPLPTPAASKRDRESTTNKIRRRTGAPKEPAPVDERSGDDDDEASSDAIKSCSASSSVETDTSDTSLTAWRESQARKNEPASSSMKP